MVAWLLVALLALVVLRAVYHRTLIEAELEGQEIEMSSRVIVPAGEYRRAADGSLGMHIDEFPEAGMLLRWKNHEFDETEREVARRWREELATNDPDRMIGIVRNILPVGTKISNLEALKRAVDDFCESSEREVVARALNVLEARNGRRRRCSNAGRTHVAPRCRCSRLTRRTFLRSISSITSASSVGSSRESGRATGLTWRTSTTAVRDGLRIQGQTSPPHSATLPHARAVLCELG